MKLEQYSKKFIHYYHLEIPKLLEKYLAASPGHTFCDLGCGDGSLLYALNEKGYFKGREVFALDASEERVNVARQINPAFKCFKDDVCAIKNVGPQSIDFAASTQVIEHVPDEECMIREIKRILKKDGLLYLTTVFKKRYGWYFYRSNGKWTIDPTHLREFTDEKPLLRLFDKYGFEVLENTKMLLWFPLFDFILKRIGLDRKIYLKKAFHALRRIKVPIIGYYSWEMVLKNIT